MSETTTGLTKKSALELKILFQQVLSAVSKGDNEVKDTVDLIWQGTQLILPGEPEPMSYDRGIEVLAARKAAAIQEYRIQERIQGMPFDAAAAFARVLKDRYGWVPAQSQVGWFGMEIPPVMQMIKTGPKAEDYIEVPIGEFKLHDIESTISTGFAPPLPDARSRFMDFYIAGTVTHEDRKVVMEIVTQVRDELAKNSIYRGKAMRLRATGDGLAEMLEPEFISVDATNPSSLILNEEIEALLKMTLFTPITQTLACRKHNIPLKRGILLHGVYGTGKSLAGAITARVATDNSWTYLVVDNAKALKPTLELAKMFQPCVVFAEDIDRAVDKNRNDAANDIVNVIDGVIGKGDEIITVLTTNHLDRLPAVMLRHGRLDTLVPFSVPDEKAALRLIELYGGDLIAAGDRLDGVGPQIKGLLPATIREVVERAKLGMLMREDDFIGREDLIAAAVGIRAHADLLTEAAPKKTVEQEFGEAFKKVLLSEPINGKGVLDKIEQQVDQIRARV